MKQQVRVEVQLAMLQATYDGYRESTMRLWRGLSETLGIPVMQESLAELICGGGRRSERLEARVAELEEAITVSGCGESGACT